MEFTLPLERYKEHNMVLHGWTDLTVWRGCPRIAET
uniref:Uncharacterized protein n=1 Tax=Nelumbo nucifera TaxID=4432 RepID=A0A822ZFQ7_NELNU|nr:TPA_asm: hypothetical protein HUJ06_001643 [Nelumbo nucifera]